MGFYLRKSLSVGPFRFNLSGSGIGVSTGIKGFRIGMGPRGNYVHMGRGGLYFRTSLPSFSNQNQEALPPEVAPTSSGIEMQEIESGSTLEMVDSSSADLLAEINGKAKKLKLWPVATACSSLMLFILIVMSAPAWAFIIISPLCIAAIWAASLRDKLKKSVVLFYEMEPHIEQAYQNLHTAFERLNNCHRKWHVEARGAVSTTYEWKTNAGASSILQRKPVQLSTGAPPYFKTNVMVPILPAGRQTLYFFPDRLLVYAPEGVGAVSYDQLIVGWADSRFIEDEGVPSDSRIVGRTWRYVNKSGGPDRRFHNNREIPIALYGAIRFISRSGLNEAYQFSQSAMGPQFETAVTCLAHSLQEVFPSTENLFITCPCNNCAGHIEFPSSGVGQVIVCPHCGLETTLFKPLTV